MPTSSPTITDGLARQLARLSAVAIVALSGAVLVVRILPAGVGRYVAGLALAVVLVAGLFRWMDGPSAGTTTYGRQFLAWAAAGYPPDTDPRASNRSAGRQGPLDAEIDHTGWAA
jgi:hypothetical protein